MKKFLCLFLILSLITATAACGAPSASAAPSAEPELERYSAIIYDSFDTITSVLAYCSSEEEFDAIYSELNSGLSRYHKLFDIYNSYPGIVNLKDVNDHAAEEPMEVPVEIIELLSFAKQAYDLTLGEMNPAMGSVLTLWHNARELANEIPEEAYLPDEVKLRAAAEHVDIDDLIIDAEACTVFIADPEMKIDVGAIAKGYSVERIAQKFEAEGYDNILISAGGNVRAIGCKPGDALWTVGITNPDLQSSVPYVATVAVDGKAVVTSGGYQRFFVYDGERYHHIIDRKSLKPENRFLSVSIIADDSGLADALSTAVFNMDYEDGLNFINSLEGVGAMWIMNDQEQRFSPEFEKYVKS